MPKTFSDTIRWLGHDAFRVEACKTIYFDPYQISDGSPADLIFISHDHFDHCSPDDVMRIQGPNTIIITEKDSASKLTGDIRVMKPGEQLELAGVKVTAVPSYNTDKNFHPKTRGWLGFIVEIEGVKLYHAGDTDFIPEMKDFNVDIALLPVSGTYVMHSAQAAKAAIAINPKLAIPMHYGAIVGNEQDAIHFQTSLEGKVEVLLLKKTS